MTPVELEVEAESRSGAWHELRPALERLDGLLERSVAAARRSAGTEAPFDMFRGLHLGVEDVDRLMGRPPGEPGFGPTVRGNGEAAPRRGARLDWLGRAFGLTPFDLDVVLVALGPHVDLKYERIYSYLQDDVTRRRPSVDLALNLLCTAPGEKLERRAHFAAQAPLLRHGLIRLSAEPHQVDSPLLALAIGLDEQVVDVLTGQGGLDRRLVPSCRKIVPSGAEFWPVEDRRLEAAQGLIVRGCAEERPLRLYLHGARGMGQRQAVERLAVAVGAPLLTADLAHSRPGAAGASYYARPGCTAPCSSSRTSTSRAAASRPGRRWSRPSGRAHAS